MTPMLGCKVVWAYPLTDCCKCLAALSLAFSASHRLPRTLLFKAGLVPVIVEDQSGRKHCRHSTLMP